MDEKYTHQFFTLGIGCRAVCTASQLDAFVRARLDQAAITPQHIVALATWASRLHHPAITTLATAYGWPLDAYTTEALHTVESRLHHRSQSLFERTGLYNIAESAALCAADEIGTSLAEIALPRQEMPVATLALARIHTA